jgi:hypothetical protein
LLSPQGVRSICFKGDVMSFGTGGGRICFYDLRAGRIVPQGVRAGTPCACTGHTLPACLPACLPAAGARQAGAGAV